MNRKYILLVLTLLLSSAWVVSAQAGEGKHKRKPPKEAIEACLGKNEGDEVTFTGRKGELLSATCVILHGELAALPKGHKRRDD